MPRILIAVLFLLVPFTGLTRTPDALVVGMELSYPPFEMADSQGTPIGISVDLAQNLGLALQKKIEIRNLPFDGLIPSLKTGKIDLIISSMTATPERAQAIDFSDPYLNTGLAILVGKKSPIQSSGDLDHEKITIAVKQGTTGHLYAITHFHSAKLLVLDREAACVTEVVQGKASAFIYDQMSVLKHSQQNSETTRALLQPLQNEAWAIGLKKGDQELKAQVNDFLKSFRDKGGFLLLTQKWLAEQKAAFDKLGVPFIF